MVKSDKNTKQMYKVGISKIKQNKKSKLKKKKKKGES